MKNLKGEKSNCVVAYTPHGINSNTYKSTNVPDEFRKKVFGGKKFKFVLFWSNRNIKRKQPSDVIWAYSKFVDLLPSSERNSVCLLMHTTPVDKNGTDLYKVKESICPSYNVIFSSDRISQEKLNWLYNLSDITINIAGNEGFGLTTAESLMTETPIIVNVTGGLQDQCGFKYNINKDKENSSEDWKEFTAADYIKFGTLHNFRKWKDNVSHGNWVKPIWPRVHTIVGSIPTPYIIDDKVDILEVADTILSWYNTPKKERKAAGKLGREWMLDSGGLTHKNMAYRIGRAIDFTLENFTPKKRYNIYKIV